MGGDGAGFRGGVLPSEGERQGTGGERKKREEEGRKVVRVDQSRPYGLPLVSYRDHELPWPDRRLRRDGRVTEIQRCMHDETPVMR